MKIALLVPAPFDAVSGGYAYDRRLVEGLRAGGHAVRVVELAGRHPQPDAAAEAAACAAIEGCEADEAVVIDGLALPGFLPVLDVLEERRAVGLIHHPTAVETGVPEDVRDRLRERERAIFPRLARLVTTSRLTASRLPEEFAVEPARVAVVEPGTDPAPRATGSGGGCEILSVGVLVPRKGHDGLIHALGRLRDLDWRLTVVGPERNPDHAATLRALTEELAIAERVRFAGDVDSAALERLYAGADIFALFSWWEGYGMAAAEAMARGLPLALSKGGALEDLMPKGGGISAAPGDSDSFSRALRRMIFDLPLRQSMAEASWQAGQRLPRWDDRAAAFVRELEQARG
ncbi:glycosyltransferase family 4 protein [Roseomonas elaeocarpi]|uniref:Glycosyltransferase family 4 protein n=1 Tax=Roseomonas elaeocarpi TaxID=907779 RepID=A0ABV6JT68_9PROT